MKLSYKDKVEMYRLWKEEHFSMLRIGELFGLSHGNVEYIVHLADRHGTDILKHRYHSYSADFKIAAIKRVIVDNEIMEHVSIDLGLSNQGILPRWIKEFKKNGYTIVERKKGRHGKEENNRTAGSRKQSPKGEELKAYYRTRIHKKIKRLSFEKKEIPTRELVQAVTELRQEQECSVTFIINCINSFEDLPHITRSTYYYTLRTEDKDAKNAEIMAKIKEIFEKHKGRYGYRRITMELRRQGYNANIKKVHRLMKRMGLEGKVRRRKHYSSYQGEVGKIAPNLIKRDFFADKPNEKVYADVTQFNWKDRKIYMHAMLDGCAGDIVAYDISYSPDMAQTMRMLNQAIEKYPALTGAIFHTDQGWQYQHIAFQKFIEEHNMKQSMSRKGNCLDDALMENFFGLMKTEMFYGEENTFSSVEELIQAMRDYITYFNSERIKIRLKGLTPLEYRNQALSLTI
jgi:transposase InsO family protein/transposase-like protein